MDENPLLLKIQRIINRPQENDEILLNGLDSVFPLMTNNSAIIRRTLRSNMEGIQLNFYENLLVVFGDVKKSVDSVDSCVNKMLQTCRRMNETVTSVKSETAYLLEEAQKLQSDSKMAEMKAYLLELLVGSYQISQEDAYILSSKVHPIDNTFFSALSRCREMKNNCKELFKSKEMAFSSSMMNEVVKTLDLAFERLYEWAQNECRNQVNETPEISLNLRCALSELQEKPVLLKYALDEYASARRKATVRLLMDTLTIGHDPNSSTINNSTGVIHVKPIQMRSHDPVRFVSDILACIHQLTASEKEYINSLCKNCHDTLINDLKTICLDTITESFCAHFKLTMENLLISHHDAVVLYRINNILSFYQHTFMLLLESTASLVLCVDDVQQLCKRLLLNTLKQFVKQNLEQPDLPNSELSPNELVNDTLQLLVQMLGSQDISLLPNNMVEAEHKEIADALIFPLIEYCEKSAVLIPISSQSHIQLMDDQYINDTVDSSFMSPSATYLTNCLCAIEASLSKIPFGNFHREYIASKLDTCLNSLVSAQFSYVIKRTGLSHIDETLKESKPGTYTKAKFSNLLKDFNAYLSNPDELLLP
uniref:Conserved oligomeric Golgi complex subunit 6 n=1 Tax=Trichobilharzia regenti TaxID=157069 RepID=A0AA85JSJ7_TRIRE